MNRVGMMIDLSHAADETVDDVLTESRVIFSHSSARALVDSPRNVPDDLLRRLRDNGGIIMISFVADFTTREAADWYAEYEAEESTLKATATDPAVVRRNMALWEHEHPTPHVTVADVADHFDHARRIAGIDHVGIGSDFEGDPSVIENLEDVSKYPNLLRELARRGWTAEDLRKVAGENFLRVMRAVENVAAAMQGG